jgi:hypothetical protein
VLLTGVAGVSIGCGQTVPLNLAIDPWQHHRAGHAAFLCPYDHAETTLVGGVERRRSSIDPWNLISPEGIAAAIRIDDVLIAGDRS